MPSMPRTYLIQPRLQAAPPQHVFFLEQLFDFGTEDRQHVLSDEALGSLAFEVDTLARLDRGLQRRHGEGDEPPIAVSGGG